MFFTKRDSFLLITLLLLLVVVFLLSIGLGAVKISLDEIFSSFSNFFNGNEFTTLNERIFIDIRLPRSVLSILVGATLAVGGIIVQALFRNPIVEPGLIGTSSGAAFGASFFIVLGNTFAFATNNISLPLIACIGGIIGTFLVFSLSKINGNNNSVTVLLLIGVAVNALFLSGIGFLSYIARDPQARSITFWNLGTLSGANWQAVQMVAVFSVSGLILSYFLGKKLNTLILGNDEASYLGINVNLLKYQVLIINVIMVSVATSFVGVIGFVGLIVPHIIRMISGSDIRKLIIFGSLFGAIFLCFSDLVARLLLSPAELPIGIVTSFVGVPVFIILLRKSNYFF